MGDTSENRVVGDSRHRYHYQNPCELIAPRPSTGALRMRRRVHTLSLHSKSRHIRYDTHLNVIMLHVD